MKIKDVLKNEIMELKKCQMEDAILKARMLVEYVLGVSNEYLAVHLEEEIDGGKLENLEKYRQELMAGKPIQYITHSQNFYGLNFYVDENVLIPQPDTEILVEEVISFLKNRKQMPKVLDICTGSGAIAIAIAKNVSAEIMATDISSEALAVAEKNARKHGAKIQFLQSDLFDKIEGKFDCIVSNPPYIETETIEQLSAEVKNEPRLALDGGEDGLTFYRILAEKAPHYLTKEGILALEIGYQQREKVMELLEKSGFAEVYSKKDFGGQDRIVVGKWR